MEMDNMDNNKTDQEQNLSKLPPFPNHGFVENSLSELIINENGEIEIVKSSDPRAIEKAKKRREDRIQLIKQYEKDIDDVDVPMWLDHMKNETHKHFDKEYYSLFRYLEDWIKDNKGLSYAEYKTYRKKDEVVAEEAMHQFRKNIKEADKKVEKAWEESLFKTPEHRPITTAIALS